MLMRSRIASFAIVLSGFGLQGLASTEDGSCLPPWELLNDQTQSPTFHQSVKSSSYRDLPTVVMLLSSG